MSGSVEAKLGGQWGSVCGTRFDDLDARVRYQLFIHGYKLI